jgi:DNA polymerase-3 subunit epsilon
VIDGPETTLDGVTELVFLDVETSGLDPEKDCLLEIAVARWSYQYGSLVSAQSVLIDPYPEPLEVNSAFHINGIYPAMCKELGVTYGNRPDIPSSDECLLIAHNADFDRKWLPEFGRYRWICSCDDFEYPRHTGSRALTQIALAHGVGVVSAHRAIDDVLTLARLFERVAEIDRSAFEKRLARCLRPKARFVVADRGYDEDRNKLVKAHRFRWNPDEKVWWRKMFIDDVAALPFAVERAGD